ncbi:MAG: hypothetical protein GTO02_06910 [Candidatus Dadabacteria bacterium]|nr:hypothetical protein [Candidatus Dadabacteria bacterium]
MHNYEEGWTDVNIEEALINHRNYIDITRYYTQISPYIRKFGKKNILIIDFEDLIHQRKSVLKKISEFLCINFNGFTDYEKIHENKSVGGHKKHHKYNYPSISLKIIKSLFPTMYKKITDNSKRGFTEKPKLNIKYRRMIKNLLYLDIIELQKLIDKDLGKWLCIED